MTATAQAALWPWNMPCSFRTSAMRKKCLKRHDIVYVRQPRYGDNTNTTWPEVFHPARLDPGADLMLLHPDGSEELLVAGGNGGVTDPFISFDGQWCYYVLFPDLRPSALNGQRGDLPYQGCDIYKIPLQTRQIVRLTFQEFTPNTGAGKWNYTDPSSTGWQTTGLGYGLLNLGPCPVAGSKLAFTSNRNAHTPPKGYTNPTLQLFVMDEDGQNVTFVAPGIFAIPLQTPIANLPTQHITASVADAQGNANVVTVRFRVDAGFQILSLDASSLNSRRLTLRFENPSGATNHMVLCVDELAKPASAWTTLNLLNAVDEPDQARRLEVELPNGVQGSLFLRVRKP